VVLIDPNATPDLLGWWKKWHVQKLDAVRLEEQLAIGASRTTLKTLKNKRMPFLRFLQSKKVKLPADNKQLVRRVTLNAGETLYIPAGFIYSMRVNHHEDYVGVSGFFLHVFAISQHLLCHSVVASVHHDASKSYPYFTQLMLFTAKFYALKLRNGEISADGLTWWDDPAKGEVTQLIHLLGELTTLAGHLTLWLAAGGMGIEAKQETRFVNIEKHSIHSHIGVVCVANVQKLHAELRRRAYDLLKQVYAGKSMPMPTWHMVPLDSGDASEFDGVVYDIPVDKAAASELFQLRTAVDQGPSLEASITAMTSVGQTEEYELEVVIDAGIKDDAEKSDDPASDEWQMVDSGDDEHAGDHDVDEDFVELSSDGEDRRRKRKRSNKPAAKAAPSSSSSSSSSFAAFAESKKKKQKTGETKKVAKKKKKAPPKKPKKSAASRLSALYK
jgi:hypothetical protein